MRLRLKERQIIKQIIHDLDPNAIIYLFGSRIDDKKKGGDIDLLILSKYLGFSERRKIKIKLDELIGEQKIDLLITNDTSQPFVQLILEEAISL